eukprot:GDKJ01010002.1.p1 GENE.GDKJ01010002.1~~GDKJ01010002.1.p1  ORF type:complete len:105 (+),score=28.12 GDKJ01010002.1:18-332(+)
MSLTRITSVEQFEEVKSTGIVAIKFYADWCGPCKMIAPAIAECAEKHPNVKFYEMNSDDFCDVFESLDGSSLPYVVFFKDGLKFDSFVGIRKENLEKKLSYVSQ